VHDGGLQPLRNELPFSGLITIAIAKAGMERSAACGVSPRRSFPFPAQKEKPASGRLSDRG
jgi:hypothetical protein